MCRWPRRPEAVATTEHRTAYLPERARERYFFKSAPAEEASVLDVDLVFIEVPAICHKLLESFVQHDSFQILAARERLVSQGIQTRGRAELFNSAVAEASVTNQFKQATVLKRYLF